MEVFGFGNPGSPGCPFSLFLLVGRVPLLKKATAKSWYPDSNLSGGPSIREPLVALAGALGWVGDLNAWFL